MGLSSGSGVFMSDMFDHNSGKYVSYSEQGVPGVDEAQAKRRAKRAAKVRGGGLSAKSTAPVIESKPIDVDGYKADTSDAAPTKPTTPKVSTAQELRAQYEAQGMKEAAANATEFFVDVLNAQAQYQTAVGQAAQNIAAARNNRADVLFLGRQAQLSAQSEGYSAGQDASLAMAAQGQDVQGAGVGKVQGSLEAMGIEAGMRQYNNAIAEALGYEVEEINTKAQLKAAKAARNAAIIGSALKTTAKIGTAAATGGLG